MFEYYSNHTKLIEKELEAFKDNVRKVEPEYRRLQNRVRDIDKRTSVVNSKIEDLQIQIMVQNCEIEKLENEKQELEKQLPNLRQLYNIGTKNCDEKRVELVESKSIDIKNLIQKMDSNNTRRISMKSTTRTIELMENFYKSSDIFLMFENAYWTDDYRNNISLIAIHRFDESIPCHKEKPTVSELKKSFNSSMRYALEDCPERLFKMLKEISECINSHKIISGDRFTFDIPYLFGGKTKKDLSNFGCMWTGGGDYVEKTLYGDTTNFLMIGFTIE